MDKEKSTFDKNAILFSQLVLSFQASAMQQMGKIKNPFTDKIERNMSQAQMSIDMLAMIQEKMKGNLNDEESRLLERILFELRLNYVDEIEKDKREVEEKKKEEEEKKEERPEEKKEPAEEKEEKVGEEPVAGEEEVKTDKDKKKREEKKEKKPSSKARKKRINKEVKTS